MGTPQRWTPGAGSWLIFQRRRAASPVAARRSFVSRVVPILRCSAKGCAEPASWALRWNNPKLHTPDRRKIWLACENHRGSLSAFLSARGFLRDVVPASSVAPDDVAGPDASAGS